MQLIVLSGVVAIPIPLILFGFDTGFQRVWLLSNWLFQYFLSYVISILILSGRFIVERAMGYPNMPGSDAQAEDGSAEQGFLARLPIEYHGARLYAVSAEDHYLRVHTDRGSALILMRLTDAMRELAAADGLQTHRSWWVARAGISKTKGAGSRTSLVLKSGLDVPVARARAKRVREGLL
ncbi:MAG: LytTR family DNA-binding domain-containing protein [Pseudomonadota bacterium]